jgi:hypothetical protein
MTANKSKSMPCSHQCDDLLFGHRTSLGYEHPRNICVSHGLQQSAKHPFICFLEKKIGVYLRRFNTTIKFNDLNSHVVSTFHG